MLVVFCGCETWPSTLRQKHRLTAFGNGELRKNFVPEKYKIIEDRRRMHDKEFCDVL
jgi:formylmethanofuran dehydrogenase subunit B